MSTRKDWLMVWMVSVMENSGGRSHGDGGEGSDNGSGWNLVEADPRDIGQRAPHQVARRSADRRWAHQPPKQALAHHAFGLPREVLDQRIQFAHAAEPRDR